MQTNTFDPLAERLFQRVHKATMARFEERDAELRAMTHKQLLAEKRRLMGKARALGLDPDKLLTG